MRLWRTLTEALPHAWFGPAQGPLLLQLVRHCVRLDEIEEMIGKADPADIGAYDKLSRLSIAESQHVNALCRSLRLTLSAIKQHVASSRMKQPLGRRDFSVLYGDE